MKKTALLLAGLLLCAAATSCELSDHDPSDTSDTAAQTESAVSTESEAPETDTQPAHTHTATGEWECNVTEHWQLCAEDGERMNVEAHSLGEVPLCSVCRRTILAYEDGSGRVSGYNQQGTIHRSTDFDAAGNKIYELTEEYAKDANGTTYLAKTTEFDQAGPRIYVEEFNEYGDLTGTSISHPDGHSLQTNRFEYGYDENGVMRWKFSYSNDVLIQEEHNFMTYENDRISNSFAEKVIEYYEDGTQVFTVRNDRGLIIKEATYTADGTVENEITYGYEFADDGGYKRITIHENGRLIRDTEYARTAAQGLSYVMRDTEYFEDGSKTVKEYDESSRLVGEYTYDAEGNLI